MGRIPAEIVGEHRAVVRSRLVPARSCDQLAVREKDSVIEAGADWQLAENAVAALFKLAKWGASLVDARLYLRRYLHRTQPRRNQSNKLDQEPQEFHCAKHNRT